MRRNQKQVKRRNANFDFIGMPDELNVRLQYIDNFTDVSGSYQEVLYRGNGPFDPVYAVGGGQPLWWDELTAIYDSYVAHKCEIHVNVIQLTGTGSSAFAAVGVYPNISSTAALDLTTAQEMDYATAGFVGPNTGGPNQINMSSSFTTQQLYAVPRSFARNSSDFISATSTTPTNEWLFHLYYGSLDASSDVNLRFTVRLIYNIKFFNRKIILPSFKGQLSDGTRDLNYCDEYDDPNIRTPQLEHLKEGKSCICWEPSCRGWSGVGEFICHD
jgi:hypothetical protein